MFKVTFEKSISSKLNDFSSFKTFQIEKFDMVLKARGMGYMKMIFPMFSGCVSYELWVSKIAQQQCAPFQN